MTLPQDAPPAPYAEAAPSRPGRTLAAAIAVFLGGYLLLVSLAGSQLAQVSMSLFSAVLGRPSPNIPGSFAVLLVLQFLFAIAVVVAGLLLARGPLAGRLVGSVVVVVGSLATFLVLGARLSGALRFPGGSSGMPFQAVFANAWFAVVLIVGVAWLLSRAARLGWLSILGTLVLVPLPVMLALGNADAGIVAILMYALAALVGAGILLAGRPWRD